MNIFINELIQSEINKHGILLKFLLKEKCHRNWGKKENFVCLVPDYFSLLDKTGGWAACWEPGEWELMGALRRWWKSVLLPSGL